jgi:inosine-uridine nucleoside N-ribohydrolase
MKRTATTIILALAAMFMSCTGGEKHGSAAEPMKVIFDTDLGNDIDDVLALQMLLNYEKAGRIELVGVTLCKANPATVAFADGYLRYNDRGDIPLGYVYDGVTPFDGTYLLPTLAAMVDGQPVLKPGRTVDSGLPEAYKLLRELLADAPDGSVVLISVGPMTNIGRLMDSAPDEISPLTGVELVKRKVKAVAAMAGLYGGGFDFPEWNVEQDIPAARSVFSKCPVPLTASGWELGNQLLYPHESILSDFGDPQKHPLTIAYQAYMEMPYDRQTWDLTSVLDIVEPDKWFGYSPAGTITVDEQGYSHFTADPNGLQRYLTIDNPQIPATLQGLVEQVTGKNLKNQ